MNKVVVTSSAILGIVILIAGCGQPETTVGQVPPPAVTFAPPRPTMTDDESMDKAARDVMESVGTLVATGEVSAADLAADLQAIEEARHTLKELEAARRAAMTVNNIDVTSGSGDCSWLAEDFEAYESARQAILARFGFVR